MKPLKTLEPALTWPAPREQGTCRLSTAVSLGHKTGRAWCIVDIYCRFADRRVDIFGKSTKPGVYSRNVPRESISSAVPKTTRRTNTDPKKKNLNFKWHVMVERLWDLKSDLVTFSALTFTSSVTGQVTSCHATSFSESVKYR